MESVLLVIHLFLALAIIGLVLLQRSEGGGLGIGGGGGLGGLATPQGAANLLSRATAICAGAFFLTSLVLGILAGGNGGDTTLMEALKEVPVAAESPAEGAQQELQETDDTPATAPAVPIAK